MEQSELFPDVSTDYMLNAVPSSLVYPTSESSSGGIWSPYELLRLIGFAITKHSATAVEKVINRATEFSEYPLDTPGGIDANGIFFAIRPLESIRNDVFPACFIMFGAWESINFKTLAKSPPREAVDAMAAITVTPVITENDPDIAEIKVLRLCSAIEYLLIDTFMNPAHTTNHPRKSPFHYIDFKVDGVEWCSSPTIEMEQKGFARMYSMIFPITKRSIATL